MRRRSSHLCCFAIFALVIGRSAAYDLVYELPGYDGRVIVWRHDKKLFGVEQPKRLSVPATGGQLQIGFTHAGYTVADPIGKRALLNVAIKMDLAPLSAAEKTALTQAGVALDANPRVAWPGDIWIDISLTLDQVEEGRLRKACKLPAKLSGNAPFQIVWKDVPGTTLYKWLTDPKGLRFVFKRTQNAKPGIPVNWETKRAYAADPMKLTEWWDRVAPGTDELLWRGGVPSLCQDMIDFGVMRGDVGVLGIENAADELSFLAAQLSTITTENDGEFSMQKAALMNANLVAPKKTVIVESEVVETNTALFPGRILKAHPNYVKDLSGSGVGLEAINH